MSLCTPCTPCPPCDSEYPLLCEPLETTANGKRLVVEDSAACQKTIQTPASQQVLKTDGASNLNWTNGANNTVLAKSSTGIVEFDQVQTAYIADSAVTTAKINNLAVTSAKLRDSVALSVIGRSANSTGVPADIVAGTSGHFLRRSGTTLGFGAIVADDLPDGTVLNAKFYDSSTEFSITQIIPIDNTIPQNGEGQQIISGTITPTKTTSKIIGFVSLNGQTDTNGVPTVVAAFRDFVANAISSTWIANIYYASLVSFNFIDTPATTSSVTYTIRCGPGSADTLFVNKSDQYGSILGGSNKITLTLLEINPS